jgi:hypothetical protein
MLKSGLIIGIAVMVLGALSALITPLCIPCLAIFLGMAAGYLAGVFDKPVMNSEAVKKGALSGLIASVGAIIGQIIGSIINASLMGPEAAAEMMEQLGIDVGANYETIYQLSQVGGTICFSIMDILFMALLGMLGGVLWWQISGKKQNPHLL